MNNNNRTYQSQFKATEGEYEKTVFCFRCVKYHVNIARSLPTALRNTQRKLAPREFSYGRTRKECFISRRNVSFPPCTEVVFDSSLFKRVGLLVLFLTITTFMSWYELFLGCFRTVKFAWETLIHLRSRFALVKSQLVVFLLVGL